VASTNRRERDKEARVDAIELAQAIAARLPNAEARLVEQYRSAVQYILQREVRDRHLVDDLVQETFRITLERLRGRGIEHPERLAGFMVGIVRRLLKAHRRRARRVRNDSEEVIAQLFDPAPTPCDEAIRADEARLVQAAIRSLSVGRDRELLTRRYLLEEDNESICRTLRLTVRQLDKALYRARMRLKRKLHELAHR
jgi:RNA polymerase sigma-70 factor (ECF subfamily)